MYITKRTMYKDRRREVSTFHLSESIAQRSLAQNLGVLQIEKRDLFTCFFCWRRFGYNDSFL